MSARFPYYSVDQLKSIFGIMDDKTIMSHFGKALEVKQEQRVLPRKYLVDIFGFEPNEPFLTRMEAMKELGLKSTQINYLVRKKLLHVFKLMDRRGSSRFFLKRDVEGMRKTLIEYCNSTALLDDHNHRLQSFLSRVIKYDFEHKKHICRSQDEYGVFCKYILNTASKETIAVQMEMTSERIRQIVRDMSLRLDDYFTDVDRGIVEMPAIVSENNKLKLKVAEYEKYINELKQNNGEYAPLLNADALNIIERLKKTKLEDIGMSNRLRARLRFQLLDFEEQSRPQGQRNGKWKRDNIGQMKCEYCNLYHLLRYPVKKLDSPNNGIGKKCLQELYDLFADLGLKVNDTYYSIEVLATNVMSLIVDQKKFNQIVNGR